MCEKIHAGSRVVFKEWSNFSQIFLKVVKIVSRRLSCNEVGASYALALWLFPSERTAVAAGTDDRVAEMETRYPEFLTYA